MKKIKVLLASLLCAGLLLAGCTTKGNNGSSSAEPTSSEVVPSSSEGGSSSEGEGSSSEEPAVKTVEEVVADINGVFAGLGIDDLLQWYEDYSCYIGGLNLGAAEASAEDAEAHQTELQEATEFVVSYLPEYLTADAAGFEEEYDDYYIGLSVDSVGVDAFGYVNSSSNIIVQLQVTELSE